MRPVQRVHLAGGRTLTRHDPRTAGRRRSVALTTYRRSGVAVTTPVWIAPAGDVLVLMTGGSTGKVRRLRRDPRVQLQQCSARGRVGPGAPVVHAGAEIVADSGAQQPLLAALTREYRWQLGAAQLVEEVLGADRDRVVLRIRDAGSGAR